MDKFWYCVVEDSVVFRYRYDKLALVKDEAARLARLPENKGKKVYILDVIDVCWADENPVHWLHL